MLSHEQKRVVAQYTGIKVTKDVHELTLTDLQTLKEYFLSLLVKTSIKTIKTET